MSLMTAKAILVLIVLALLYVLYDLLTNGPVTGLVNKIWNKIPILNKIGGGEATDTTNHGTGFITPEGRGIQMGPHDQRYADHREAISAFREKRKPQFRGR